MRPRPAFTLPQLVVVALVLSLLVALLLPLVQRWREEGRRQEIVDHLRELGLAAHAYNARVKRLPPAHDGTRACQEILAPDYKNNYDILNSTLDYSCPGRNAASLSWTGIAANYYLFGTDNIAVEDITAKRGFTGLRDPVAGVAHFGYTPLAVNTIRDGTSNTLMWVTCLARPAGQDVVTTGPGSWPSQATGPFHASLQWEAAPEAAQARCASGRHAQSYSPEGIVIGLADGSARLWTKAFTWKGPMSEGCVIPGTILFPMDNVHSPCDY
jgi:type II secretory pathway pseudopilin PulG